LFVIHAESLLNFFLTINLTLCHVYQVERQTLLEEKRLKREERERQRLEIIRLEQQRLEFIKKVEDEERRRVQNERMRKEQEKKRIQEEHQRLEEAMELQRERERRKKRKKRNRILWVSCWVNQLPARLEF
jgi:flagellar biosynthesis GTPase FlhF